MSRFHLGATEKPRNHHTHIKHALRNRPCPLFVDTINFCIMIPRIVLLRVCAVSAWRQLYNGAVKPHTVAAYMLRSLFCPRARVSRWVIITPVQHGDWRVGLPTKTQKWKQSSLRPERRCVIPVRFVMISLPHYFNNQAPNPRPLFTVQFRNR